MSSLSSIQVFSRSRSVRNITSPVFVKTLRATTNLSREVVGRILSTWVAGFAEASLTWLTGSGDSPESPTSTDSSSGSPALACACHCHCASGGLDVACLCLAIGFSVEYLFSAAAGDSDRGLDVDPLRKCWFPDGPTFPLHHRDRITKWVLTPLDGAAPWPSSVDAAQIYSFHDEGNLEAQFIRMRCNVRQIAEVVGAEGADEDEVPKVWVAIQSKDWISAGTEVGLPPIFNFPRFQALGDYDLLLSPTGSEPVIMRL